MPKLQNIHKQAHTVLKTHTYAQTHTHTLLPPKMVNWLVDSEIFKRNHELYKETSILYLPCE